MTSKEVQEMIDEIEDQIERFGIMNSMKVQLSVLKSYKQDLERLEMLEQENKEWKEYSFLLEISKQHEKSKSEKLKKQLDIYAKYTGVYFDEETSEYYISVDCDFGCKGDIITKEEFEVLGE